MNKLYRLLLIIFLPIAFTISCSECNERYESSIFDELRDEDWDNDEDPNNPPLRPRRRSGQPIYNQASDFFNNNDNKDPKDKNKIKLDRLKKFLESAVDLTSIDSFGRNILHEALHATMDDFETIKCIIEKLEEKYPRQVKKLLNQQERSHPGDTPFTAAVAKSRNINIVQLLLDHGANPTDAELKIAFSSTIRAGNLEMFAYLLNRETSTKRDQFILDSLSKVRQPNLMEYFLENRNVDLNQTDQQGNTLLHNTNLTKDEVSTRLILEKDRSSINNKNMYGETPLHIAIKQGSLSLVSTLLRYGADPNVCDKDGKSPLELAEQKLEEYKKKLEGCKEQNDVNSLGLEPRAIVDKLKRNAGKNYTTDLDGID